ncbi:MAG: S9 family peptidase, partial [Myxococcales bacterium]|nr:S9 family peptidase [Myxococcales bacterium]
MKHAPNVIRALVPFLLVAGCGGAEPVHTRGGEAPSSAARAEPQDSADAYLWLEEVAGDRALAWARERNAVSTRELESTPGFRAGRDRIRAIYDSKEKIPFVGKAGKWLYNLWTDADHPRGLYRRTTLAEYRKAEPAWETVLDVDALGKAESTSWVFRGMDCLYPKYERCLLLLSRGGADAVTVREFDVEKKVFVEGGFSLPEGKVEAGWKDIDTLYVGADFGEGSMSASGYPLFTKEWKRGTELRNAPVIFRGEPGD